MTRILQAMAGAEYGGAEEFYVRLAIALNKKGLEQRIVIRKNRKRADRLRENGIEPVELKFGGPLDVGTKWSLKDQINQFKPDIALTWMNRATHMFPAVKSLLHVGRLGGYYNPKYYRSCDHLVANTNDIASYLIRNGWEQERVHYLPNFVSGQKLPAMNRKLLFTPDDAPLILAIGRLHENKGFDTLFEALARVPESYLWLAGEGPLRASLEHQAERIGIKPRVRFLGWRDDVESLYGAADIFVCSSRHEPLGNVVIEAWAHELAVVATNSVGPGDLIEQEKTGVLVPIDNSITLAEALNYLISDDKLRHSLGQKGRRVYEAGFTEKIVIDKYVNFFKSISN